MSQNPFDRRSTGLSPSSPGSTRFVYLHVVFAVWMLFIESSPWPTLTLVVSLETIFLSTLVMIGQNRAAAFQQAKDDHDVVEQETELRTNTQITREIHALTSELRHLLLTHTVILADAPGAAVVITAPGNG